MHCLSIVINTNRKIITERDESEYQEADEDDVKVGSVCTRIQIWNRGYFSLERVEKFINSTIL